MIALPIALAVLAAAVLVLAFAAALRRPVPPTRVKPWWRSRTLLVNIATILGAGLAVVEGLQGQMSTALPAWAYGLIVAAVAMINAGLRLVTNKAVTLHDSSSEP